MINSKEEFLKSPSNVVVITRELAEQICHSTRNAELRELIDSGKAIIITKQLKEDLTKRLEYLSSHAAEILQKRTSKGGRKRKPDLSPEDIELLPAEEKKRYKDRIWQRQCRERKAKAVQETNV